MELSFPINQGRYPPEPKLDILRWLIKQIIVFHRIHEKLADPLFFYGPGGKYLDELLQWHRDLPAWWQRSHPLDEEPSYRHLPDQRSELLWRFGLALIELMDTQWKRHRLDARHLPTFPPFIFAEHGSVLSIIKERSFLEQYMTRTPHMSPLWTIVSGIKLLCGQKHAL